MEFTIKQLAKITNSEIENCDNEDMKVTGLNTIDEATNNQVSFLHNEKYFNQIDTTSACCVIVPENFQMNNKVILLKNKNPYKAFQQLVLSFFPQERLVEEGVSKFADVDSSVTLDINTGVGSFSYIGKNCKIGKNVQIAQNVIIYQGVIIGDDSIIHSGCTIRENCILGKGVILQNGCIIGSDGFGFSPNGASYDKIPQVGNVILKDGVEIGANTVIDRATLASTIIGEGTKLDNLIQVGHNVEIGKNTVIAAQTGISGSANIGNHCMIGGQCGFAGHIKIGDQCGIGAKSGVTKGLKLGSIVTGNPARDLKKQRKIDGSLTRLPDLIYKFKDFEKQLSKIEKGE